MHSHAPDVLQMFSDLFQQAELPPLLKQGAMDPRVLKHYLLLHDPANAAGVTLQQYVQTLGL